MKDPYRLALSQAYVFYVRLTEDGFFNSKHNAVVIVQPIGLVCFEGNEVVDIESQREFLYLLPLDNSKICEKEESK